MILAAVALPDPSLVTAEGHWTATAYDASLVALRAAGYGSFELSRTRRLTVDAAAAIRERAAALGLAAAALHAPSLHGSGVIERQEVIAEAARALGVPVLVFHASSLRFAAADAETRRRTRLRDEEHVRALAEFAGERGMQVALENGSHPGHPAYLVGLIQTLALPNLGVTLDTGHANLRGTRAHEVAAELAPFVQHTHLHDNHGERDEHLAPGRGTIDWPALVGELRQVEYRGAWGVELKGRPSGAHERVLAETRLFLDRILTTTD